ncbi:unnamed protein product, partial [Rotaria socialis]
NGRSYLMNTVIIQGTDVGTDWFIAEQAVNVACKRTGHLCCHGSLRNQLATGLKFIDALLCTND